jgi:FkbM family methyltransferase
MDGLLGTLGSLGRRFHFPPALTKSAFLVLRNVRNRDIRYRDRDGYWRNASLGDSVEAQAFFGRRPIPDEAISRVRRGDWVVDIGAHVGLVSGALCRAVGPGGHVWAIEPVPRNIRRLEQFREENQLDRLRILPGAASAENGTATIRLPASGNSAWASFTKSWDVGMTIPVTTWRLDDLIYESKPDRSVSFIKIDVEGFEPQVLRGARRTLLEMEPLVYCEFNDILLRDAGSSSSELLAEFGDLGYSVVPRFRHRLSRLDGGLLDLLLEHNPRG